MNEIEKTHQLRPEMIYYYRSKGSKGGIHYHVVVLGENVWSIAQRYGMKQSALLEKNHMKQVEPLEKGRVLWLRFIRPCKIPVEYHNVMLIGNAGSHTQDVGFWQIQKATALGLEINCRSCCR